ncbi:fatty acid-binding protein, liver-like [Lethenteron reissneri]|uniref:fatty acid-binding protein, liver-like n=1 Tax=Lethenteron reissneri TaxID=7753 RepID=UPI002AB650FB|nr:fatty acid-binding protein, liver-like [Lethenteron reissneri]
MAFSGKWKLVSTENYDEFMKICKFPDDVIAKGRDAVTETTIEQTGDKFVVKTVTNGKEVVNSFTLGQEASLTGTLGTSAKCIAVLEGGKLIYKVDKLTHVQEVKGDELIENVTAGSVTLIRKHKRVA